MVLPKRFEKLFDKSEKEKKQELQWSFPKEGPNAHFFEGFDPPTGWNGEDWRSHDWGNVGILNAVPKSDVRQDMSGSLFMVMELDGRSCKVPIDTVRKNSVREDVCNVRLKSYSKANDGLVNNPIADALVGVTFSGDTKETVIPKAYVVNAWKNTLLERYAERKNNEASLVSTEEKNLELDER